MSIPARKSPLRVLHAAGSVESDYWMRVSLMYAQAVITDFPETTSAAGTPAMVQPVHAFAVVNSSLEWFFCSDTLKNCAPEVFCSSSDQSTASSASSAESSPDLPATPSVKPSFKDHEG